MLPLARAHMLNPSGHDWCGVNKYPKLSSVKSRENFLDAMEFALSSARDPCYQAMLGV